MKRDQCLTFRFDLLKMVIAFSNGPKKNLCLKSSRNINPSRTMTRRKKNVYLLTDRNLQPLSARGIN